MRVVYFVHDLNDPAVHRRVRMLHAAGAEVALLGFARATAPACVDGVAPVLLGRTADARLAQRAAAVLRASLGAPRWRNLVASADLILARQIETLVLASLARRLHARSAPLIFECLDIHRAMASPGAGGRLLRMAERRLLAQCQGLVVSSPHFVSQHFERVHRRLPPVTLIENKVLSSEVERSVIAEPPGQGGSAGPPWRIGWFGIIRCARSLRILADLALAFPGRVEIVIRGRVATSVLPHFDAVIAATPGLSFGGAYDRARDLPALYGDVHFAWAIDFYEAGSNSDWLLPNRLYEAGLFGAVPIACRNVATGAWLEGHGAGVLLDGDPGLAVQDLIRGLDQAGYAAMRAALMAVPQAAFLYTPADCSTLVRRLAKGDHLVPV